MSKVILIATGHKERGLCNSSELYKVIENIAPEIIFEEIPPNKFAAVYEGTRKDSLETTTIKAYLQKYPATVHLPVDLDRDEIMERKIKSDFDQISFMFNDYIVEYNDLSNEQWYLAETQGFPYLNSDRCKDIMERKGLLELEILKHIINDATQPNLDHKKLFEAYNAWLNFLDIRREEMVKNIYNYCDQNKYKMALFLVGAEHKKPIMDKVSRFEEDNKRDLNWIFNYFR